MEPSMHNMKIPLDSHIPENRLVPRRHHPLYSTDSTSHSFIGVPVILKKLGVKHSNHTDTTLRPSFGQGPGDVIHTRHKLVQGLFARRRRMSC